MKAVILVGGPGTRLQPLTDNLPKSMVPVLTVPVMEHTLAYLRRFGIEDIILTLNYLPDAIRNVLGDGSRCGVHLTYCMEEEPLGTAGAIKNTIEFLDNNPLIVLNGDIFTDLNINSMYTFHRERGAKATISLHHVEDPSAFGVVDMDNTNRVKAFIEKPKKEEAPSKWINAGTYILEPEVLDYVPAGQHYMFERGLYPDLLQKGEPVYGYQHQGYWLDMGTPGKYYTLNMDLLESRYHSPATDNLAGDGAHCHPEAVIDATANLFGPAVIDRGAQIGKKVTINGPTVIGSGCRIEEGATIDASILWENITVAARAHVDRCIISHNAIVDENTEVRLKVISPDSTKNLEI